MFNTNIVVAPQRERNTRVMKHLLRFSFIPLLLNITTACTSSPITPRPSHWASAINSPVLENFYQVDAGLYRAKLPSTLALTELYSGRISTPDGAPIKTIVPLLVEKTDLILADSQSQTQIMPLPLNTWDVTNADILTFLKITINPKNRPVLVHCRHGADRTGTMVAAYRVVVQGWSKTDAINEMKHGGFGYHPIWINLIKQIKNLPVSYMRTELGLSSP